MKKYIFLLIVCFSPCFISVNLSAQGLRNVSFKAQGLYGTILKHNTHLEQLAGVGVFGGSLSAEWLTDGEQRWHEYLNFPTLGISATYINLGNPTMLGQLFALSPYVQLPIIRTSFFNLNLKPTAGISFITKYYGNTPHDPNTLNLNGVKDAANGAIGSLLNVFLGLGANVEVPLRSGYSVVAGGEWNHASNGSVIQPNSGINMLNAYLGAKYMPRFDDVKRITRYMRDRIPREIQFETTLAGGVRQLYYKDGKNYPIASFNFSAYKTLTHWYRMGLGADIFYDGVFGYLNVGQGTGRYVRTYVTENEFKNKVRAGVAWQHEILFGDFTAGFHLGVYLYDPIKSLEPYTEVLANQGKPLKRGIFYDYNIDRADGWFYSRVVGKYYFSDHFFASIGLKTHLQKAEFIEWGLGYRF